MATDHVFLRRGEADDAEAITRLLCEAFDSRFLVNSVYATLGGTRWLSRQLASPDDFPRLRTRVGEADGRIRGVTISQVTAGRVHLDYIAVAPEATGRGLGAVLMEDLYLAAPQGVTSLDVFAANANVLRWYQKLGFERVATHRFRVVDLLAVATARSTSVSHAVREIVGDARIRAAEWGFGPATVEVAGVSVALTLLGDTVVRITDCPSELLPEVAAAVVDELPERQFMVLPPGQSADLPLAISDEMLRMERRNDR